MDNINEFSTKHENLPPLEYAKELHDKLSENLDSIDRVTKSIGEAEHSNNLDELEQLYQNEFMLYMDNISIFEDLINMLDKVERTSENEFELARLRKAAIKMCRVTIVDVL